MVEEDQVVNQVIQEEVVVEQQPLEQMLYVTLHQDLVHLEEQGQQHILQQVQSLMPEVEVVLEKVEMYL